MEIGKEEVLYEASDLLGSGVTGEVYKAAKLSDTSKKFVALKRVKVGETEDSIPFNIIKKEIDIVGKLEHPNIVKFIDYFHEESAPFVNLVFELMEMDLLQFIHSSRYIEPVKVKNYMYQTLCGLDFLHSQGIMHRDIKPQNILVSQDKSEVKIADFGLAIDCNLVSNLTPDVVTIWYRAPEVLICSAYNNRIDIWAIAVTFAEVVEGKPLLPGRSEKRQLELTFDLIGTPTEEEWPNDSPLKWAAFKQRKPKDLRDVLPDLDANAISLFTRMLHFDHKRRPSAGECLEDSYFKTFSLF